MTDSLATHKPKSGLYLKFNDGDEIKLRVLTLDPLVSEKTFTNEKTGETNVSTKFGFIVWNWNEDRAQVMEVGPGLLNRFARIHQDEDMPALNKADIKISATGEMLGRRYEVQVLPQTKDLSPTHIKEAQSLKLEELLKDAKGRLSELDSSEDDLTTSSGYEKAKATAKAIKGEEDAVVEDIGDEPINMEDIPF